MVYPHDRPSSAIVTPPSIPYQYIPGTKVPRFLVTLYNPIVLLLSTSPFYDSSPADDYDRRAINQETFPSRKPNITWHV